MARYVYMGPRIIKRLPEVMEKLGFTNRKVLLISGKTATKRIAEDVVLGYVGEVAKETEFMVINGTAKDFIKGLKGQIQRIKGLGAEVLIGVGGGKTLDMTKILAGITGTPYINVPTNASHDGTASPVISSPIRSLIEVLFGVSMKIIAPHAIIADTEIISSAPRRSIASGVGDMLAKLTATRDWRLAYMLRGEDYSEYAAAIAKMSALLVKKRAKAIAMGDPNGVAVLVKALIGSGVAMSIAGSSRPASGSEHLFSHALDALAEERGFTPALHGEQCGVGTILMAKLHGLNWRNIRSALSVVGAPVNAYELGIEPRHIVDALTIAHRMKRNYYTILGERGLTRGAAVRLAVETGVISERDAKKL